MKNLVLIIAVLFSLNLSASTPLISWQCNDILVTFNEDNTMTVGNLTYDISYQGEHMVLHTAGRGMLLVVKGSAGGLVIYNVDDRQDKKYFVKCK